MKGSRKRTNDKGAAERSLFSFINDMYGINIAALHWLQKWKNRKD